MEIKNINDFKKLLINAENGNSHAMNSISEIYAFGLIIDNIEIVKINKKQSFEWIKKSYESGNIIATEKYADYLSNGEYKYCEKDIELAMILYEKAMDAGSEIATYNLGIEYRNKQNFKKAFELYSKTNDSEKYFDELTVGLSLYYGIGTQKNKLKAFDIFKNMNLELNSEFEIEEANFMIGKIYLEGEIVQKSIETARFYLKKANKDGDHRSAKELLQIIGENTNVINPT